MGAAIAASIYPGHPGDTRLAVAIAARAAASAAAAGSRIAGIVVLPCAPFLEKAAIMMRASRFIVSISIGNSETPPLAASGTERGEPEGESGGWVKDMALARVRLLFSTSTMGCIGTQRESTFRWQ